METPTTEKDNLTHRLNCRVTEQEYKLVEARALSLGLKKSDYMRSLVLGHIPRQRYDSSTRRNLAGIGNNLNQFVARVNLGFDERQHVMEVVAEIKAILKEF